MTVCSSGFRVSGIRATVQRPAAHPSHTRCSSALAAMDVTVPEFPSVHFFDSVVNTEHVN